MKKDVVFIICITSYSQSSLSDNGLADIEDYSVPIRVNCAGHYRLLKLKYLETTRPEGRMDYQILYIANGSAYFLLDEQYQKVDAGNIVIFRPGEKQFYYYQLEDDADVYWVHFTGWQSNYYLEQFGLDGVSPHYIGRNTSLIPLFNSIIHELQLQRRDYMDISALLLQQFFHLLVRIREEEKNHSYFKQESIESAMLYMHENYQEQITIKSLAEKYHMTYNWFIQCFLDYTGSSPQVYLSNIRIQKAKQLLCIPSLRVSEVAGLVGYSDPLYFSRLFKKKTGKSPREFKETS